MKTKFSGILTLLLAFVVQLSFAQEKNISGTISDESGLPLPGVNIVVAGTNDGTQTDFDGKYSISANTGEVLTYSYVGYKTANKTVGTGNNISFNMELDVEAIDEVVITALGIKRKQDEITTSNQVVKTEELTKANNPNVLQSLTGKVSGLQINQTSGGVNGGTRIVLRGNRSITGDNQALVVIDGTISTANFLQSLDPNTIASVNVIKGANGAALYGSQGSNGAIIVTTKKGNNGDKLTINVKSALEFETVDYLPEVQTRYGQGWNLGAGFENVVYENGAWGPEFDGQSVPVGLPQADGTFVMAPYSSRGSDNIRSFFKTGITTQNGFNLSTGDSDGYVFLSAQRRNSEFVIESDKSYNTTFNFKGGKTVGKWNFSGNTTYSNSKVEFSSGDLYNDLLQTPTNVPVEAFANSGNEGHWNAYYRSPYWIRDNERTSRDQERFSITGEVGYQINENISTILRTNGLFTNTTTLNTVNEYVEPDQVINIAYGSGSGRSQTSSFNYANTNFKRYYTDFLVNFDYNLTEDITFKANVGANHQYTKDNFVRVGGNDLTVPGLYTSGNLSGGLDDTITGDNRNSFTRLALLANLDFGYKDFLFLNVTGRNDWSSVLAKSNQSFFYPSVGLAFVPTKAFDGLKGDVVNYMKVTGSFVKVGNDGGINPYEIQQIYEQGAGFPYNGQNSYVTQLNITDPALTPEFTTSYEFGLNLGLFRDRVTLDANYSAFNTTDQIIGVGASAASGVNTATVNLAETEGTAIEIDLGFKPIKSENLDWNVNIGYQNTENEVIALSGDALQTRIGGIANFADNYAIVGENFPVIQTNGYERDPQGRVLVNPNNGTPIEASGLINVGRTTPKHIVNLNTSVRFKRFTLTATMDYRTGHVFYSDAKNSYSWSGHAVENAQSGRGAFIYPNSAIETSPGVYEANTTVPSGGTTAASFIQFFSPSTGWTSIGENFIFDATAFKVRELSLRYDVKPEFLKNTMLTAVSMSATARNPFVVLPAENRGYGDPEGSFGTGNAAGISQTGSNYPPTKTFGFGLNLTF